MPRARLSPTDLSDVSRRCIAALVDGGGDTTTTVLVAASGLSERTFFRYFPSKADCIRPVLEAGYRRFVAEVVDRLAAGSAGTLLDLARDAFVGAYRADELPRDERFVHLLVEIPAYRRVWLEINEDTAQALAAALAERTGAGPDEIALRLTADEMTLLAVSSLRVMVRSGLSAAEAADLVVAARRHDPLDRSTADAA